MSSSNPSFMANNILLHLMLATVALAQEQPACVMPVRVGNVTLDNGYVARGVALKAGGQDLAFRIDPTFNNTFVYGSNCLRGDLPAGQCTTFRGGLYRQLESQTRGRVNESRIADDTADGRQLDYDSEVMTLNEKNNITDFPLAVALSEIGGDESYAPMNGLGLGLNSTVLSLLYSTGRIPSRSWSYFAGRIGATRDAQFDGSLVLGGYDRANTQGSNLTLPIQQSDKCGSGLPVRVTNMTMNYPNGTDYSIFTRDQPMLTCLDPGGVAVMSIPYVDVFQNFVEISGGLYTGGNAGRSFGINYYTMLYENETVAYKGDISVEIEGSMTIRIPNDQLVRPELYIADSGEIQANVSRPILLINSLQSSTGGQTPSLGSGFFAAMTLFVNADSGKFTIWPGRATYEQDLVPIATDGSTATCTSTTQLGPEIPASSGLAVDNHKGLSNGAIAGIVVGAVAAIALIGLALFFLRKRKSGRGSHGPATVTDLSFRDYYGAPAHNAKYQSPVQEPQEIGPGVRYSSLAELEAEPQR